MARLRYAVGTRVRLTQAFAGLSSGSQGTVVGFYVKDPPAYAVAIAGESVEIPPEYVEEVDAETA